MMLMLNDEGNTYEFFLLATIFNADVGFTSLAEDLEWEMLEIRLDFGIIELASNETFCIEDTVGEVLQRDIARRL